MTAASTLFTRRLYPASTRACSAVHAARPAAAANRGLPATSTAAHRTVIADLRSWGADPVALDVTPGTPWQDALQLIPSHLVPSGMSTALAHDSLALHVDGSIADLSSLVLGLADVVTPEAHLPLTRFSGRFQASQALADLQLLHLRRRGRGLQRRPPRNRWQLGARFCCGICLCARPCPSYANAAWWSTVHCL